MKIVLAILMSASMVISACGSLFAIGVPDLSTDDKVLEALNQAEKRDAKDALEKSDVCIKRSDNFKNLITIGFFANDAGCMFAGFFVSGEYITDYSQASRNVLKETDWVVPGKTIEENQKIALQWMEEVSAFETILDSDKTPKDFEKANAPKYHPPSVQAVSDRDAGGWIVNYWVREESGMSPENTYKEMQFMLLSTGHMQDKPKVMKT